MGWEMAGLELDGRTGDCLTDFQPLVVAAEIQMQMLRARIQIIKGAIFYKLNHGLQTLSVPGQGLKANLW